MPLILTGARQVGKTYLVRSFAKQFAPNFCEINFEEDPDIKAAFEGSLDPEHIVEQLSLRLRRSIAEDDLLFFDEAQDCPVCLTALKYFAEKRPQQPVIAAGSLLGLALSGISFPVGKVQYQWLGPLTFEEFLLGLNDEQGVATLQKARSTKQLTPIGHQYLWNQLKRFYYSGGLPKSVLTLSRAKPENQLLEMQSVREVQASLVRDYQSDFSKHSGKANAMHIRSIFSNVPLQLASHEDRSTDKYKFSHADLGSVTGYARLHTPIDWLKSAGLLYQVKIANKAQHPLELFCKDNLFKLYVFDVGILGSQLRLPAAQIVEDDYGQSKGYFAETLALQALVKSDQSMPYCWNEGSAEIEFLTVLHSEIVPIEVKAGQHTKAKSLQSFIKRYSPRAAVKLHAGMIGYDPVRKLHTLPLYLAWDLETMDLW